MKKLPIGIQDIVTILHENYIYVDKTQHIYKLITEGRNYFLSRPRRFGKSLLISTLKEIFSGNKELFADLWISSSDYNWNTYPIIHIDFSSISHETPEDLKINLSWLLEWKARQAGISLGDAPSLEAKLYALVTQLSQQGKVVILVDEYDHPLLSHLHNYQVAHEQQSILKDFYTAIKSLSAYIRFVFLTGISKFSKTSVFTGINNLEDISNSQEYGTLVGFTQEELLLFFDHYLARFADKEKTTLPELVHNMQAWYNGYRFAAYSEQVYNPFSVLLALKNKRFSNYWFETGTPSFLKDLFRHNLMLASELDGKKVSEFSLGSVDLEPLPLFALLYQSGYVTIKDYSPRDGEYTVGYPNLEVHASFIHALIDAFARIDKALLDNYLSQLRDALRNEDLNLFLSMLSNFYGSLPESATINHPKNYEALFYLILEFINLTLYQQSPGKGLFITPQRQYVFEFKANGNKHNLQARCAQESAKPTTCVALSFAVQSHTLNWHIENT